MIHILYTYYSHDRWTTEAQLLGGLASEARRFYAAPPVLTLADVLGTGRQPWGKGKTWDKDGQKMGKQWEQMGKGKKTHSHLQKVRNLFLLYAIQIFQREASDVVCVRSGN